MIAVLLLESVDYLLDITGADLEYFRLPEVNFVAAISASIVLVVAGGLAGLFPAMQAARVKPIEALKDE